MFPVISLDLKVAEVHQMADNDGVCDSCSKCSKCFSLSARVENHSGYRHESAGKMLESGNHGFWSLENYFSFAVINVITVLT